MTLAAFAAIPFGLTIASGNHNYWIFVAKLQFAGHAVIEVPSVNGCMAAVVRITAAGRKAANLAVIEVGE